jgi:FtsZ-interacting cell division protein ZipA
MQLLSRSDHQCLSIGLRLAYETDCVRPRENGHTLPSWIARPTVGRDRKGNIVSAGTVWLIVAIIVIVLVIALIVVMMNKRKTEQRRVEAEQLRAKASGEAPQVDESGRQAAEAAAEAERARVQAERAEAQAAEARQTHQMDEAGHEERLREADRIDPDVDHQADGYQPRSPVDGGTAEGTPDERRGV